MQKAEIGKTYRTALVPELRSIDERARTIEFVASTEAVDRYGDVIRTAGWKLENYRKNPVFLFGHKSNEPPIGKCVEIHTESNPAALVQKIQFADASTYPFADTIFRLYAGGYLRAVSVGFMPLEQPVPFSDLEGNFVGYEFTSQELLELSSVAIPANPEALARCVQKGFAQTDLERVFSKELGREQVEAIHRACDEIDAKVLDVWVRRLSCKRAVALQKAVELIRLLVQHLDFAKLAGVSAPTASETDDDIVNLQQLAAAFKPSEKNAEIATIDDLGDALSVESSIISRSGSRKWRDVR